MFLVHSAPCHAPCHAPSTSPGMADARNRLQEISNTIFEELAADVYDEVDRRETDSCKHVPMSCSRPIQCPVPNVMIHNMGIEWHGRCQEECMGWGGRGVQAGGRMHAGPANVLVPCPVPMSCSNVQCLVPMSCFMSCSMADHPATTKLHCLPACESHPLPAA